MSLLFTQNIMKRTNTGWSEVGGWYEGKTIEWLAGTIIIK